MGDEVLGQIAIGAFLSPILGFLGYFAFHLAKFGWWVAGLLANSFAEQFDLARFFENIS